MAVYFEGHFALVLYPFYIIRNVVAIGHGSRRYACYWANQNRETFLGILVRPSFFLFGGGEILR